MTPEERQELISQYEAGYDEVVKSLDGFPADTADRSSASRQMECVRNCSAPRRQRDERARFVSDGCSRRSPASDSCLRSRRLCTALKL